MMHTYIALFRGINVGGSNLLPMRELVATLESLGLKHVSTYIQSGNAVFGSKSINTTRLRTKIRTAIEEARGFRPDLMLLGVEEMEQVIASNPFPEATADPKQLHLFFLKAVPARPDLVGLERVKSDGEQFVLQGKVFYLYAPHGIGRSKLAPRVEKLLGVSATARNWRTVVKVLEMTGR